jgi:hypothetical protein
MREIASARTTSGHKYWKLWLLLTSAMILIIWFSCFFVLKKGYDYTWIQIILNLNYFFKSNWVKILIYLKIKLKDSTLNLHIITYTVFKK